VDSLLPDDLPRVVLRVEYPVVDMWIVFYLMIVCFPWGWCNPDSFGCWLFILSGFGVFLLIFPEWIVFFPSGGYALIVYMLKEVEMPQ